MPNGLTALDSNHPAENTSQDDLFELELIRDDIISDILFLIGTLISIHVNFEAEKEIVCPEETQTSVQSTAAVEATRIGRIIIVILLFLAGTIIIAYTTYSRLSKQKAELSESSGQVVLNNIKGGELVLAGLLIRIAGYVLSYAGSRIRAENPV